VKNFLTKFSKHNKSNVDIFLKDNNQIHLILIIEVNYYTLFFIYLQVHNFDIQLKDNSIPNLLFIQ